MEYEYKYRNKNPSWIEEEKDMEDDELIDLFNGFDRLPADSFLQALRLEDREESFESREASKESFRPQRLSESKNQQKQIESLEAQVKELKKRF
jgi:hypothetical protein